MIDFYLLKLWLDKPITREELLRRIKELGSDYAILPPPPDVETSGE